MPEVLFCVKLIKLDLASVEVPKRLQAFLGLPRVTLWSCVSVPSPLTNLLPMGPFHSVFSGGILENTDLKRQTQRLLRACPWAMDCSGFPSLSVAPDLERRASQVTLTTSLWHTDPCYTQVEPVSLNWKKSTSPQAVFTPLTSFYGLALESESSPWGQHGFEWLFSSFRGTFSPLSVHLLSALSFLSSLFLLSAFSLSSQHPND